MSPDAFNALCASLSGTTHVVQWDGADVWKVGGRMFAVGAWTWGAHAGITFKVSELAFEILRDMPGLRPAPYLASRGLKWIQQHGEPGLGEADLATYIGHSHAMIAAALPKKTRLALGLV